MCKSSTTFVAYVPWSCQNWSLQSTKWRWLVGKGNSESWFFDMSPSLPQEQWLTGQRTVKRCIASNTQSNQSLGKAECHSKDLFLQKTHGDEGRWVALSSLNFVALNRSNYFNKCLESKSISLSWFSSGGGWFANENFQHDMATVHFWWII